MVCRCVRRKSRQDVYANMNHEKGMGSLIVHSLFLTYDQFGGEQNF